jgi:pSer/pThr/pTyr-binding forkhead associated (FHA) protein
MIANLQLRFDSIVREFTPGTTVMVGRDPNCTVVINDERVSRRHLSLYIEDGQWVVTHLSKSNPTFMNGVVLNTQPIEGSCVLFLSQLSNGPRLEVDLLKPADSEPELRAKQSVPLREIVAQRALQADAQPAPATKKFARLRIGKRGDAPKNHS